MSRHLDTMALRQAIFDNDPHTVGVILEDRKPNNEYDIEFLMAGYNYANTKDDRILRLFIEAGIKHHLDEEMHKDDLAVKAINEVTKAMLSEQL